MLFSTHIGYTFGFQCELRFNNRNINLSMTVPFIPVFATIFR